MTAQKTYNMKLKNAKEKINKINSYLIRKQNTENLWEKNWGNVGDMEYLNEQLDNIIELLSI